MSSIEVCCILDSSITDPVFSDVPQLAPKYKIYHIRIYALNDLCDYFNFFSFANYYFYNLKYLT